MRPIAYETRCPECLCRVTIFDEWQVKKIKDEKLGTTRDVIWFDPDIILSRIHSC